MLDKMVQNSERTARLTFEEITIDNIKIAAKLQYEIFPTSSAYMVYKRKVAGKNTHLYIGYIAYLENEPIGVTGIYEITEYPDTAWLSWFGIQKHRVFIKSIWI